VQTGFKWLRLWSSGGLCKHDKEPSGSIKDGGFLTSKAVSFSTGLHTMESDMNVVL